MNWWLSQHESEAGSPCWVGSRLAGLRWRGTCVFGFAVPGKGAAEFV